MGGGGSSVAGVWRYLVGASSDRNRDGTIRRGIAELQSKTTVSSGRQRAVGGGRKQVVANDLELLPALMALVEPDVRGDPMQPLIEDSPTDADLLAIKLEDVNSANFSIDTVETLSDGLRLLSTNQYDVVLLDLNLPDSYGIETCQRTHLATPSTPIIVLTGLADEERALECFKVGAQDYIGQRTA